MIAEDSISSFRLPKCCFHLPFYLCRRIIPMWRKWISPIAFCTSS